MEFAQVVEVVRSELGAHPDELFKDFAREPIAAASLGQVHTARLQDGTEVVVKVQYPGVEKALESDLANAAVLVRGFALTGNSLDARPYYEELRSSLLRELDYTAEAAQAESYRRAAERYPELVVPRVVPERSARRVLCLTRLEGQGLIRARRGAIHIIDRPGLIATANSTYGLAEREYERLLGEPN